jgi:hypothetical protein
VGKSKYYIFSVYVCSHSYPTYVALALYYIIICRLSWSTIFFSHKRLDFRGKSIEHKMCVLILFTNFVWHIVRRIKREIVINVQTSSCKVPVILVRFWWILNFLTKFSKNIWTWNFVKFRAVGAELIHDDGDTDKRTEGRTEAWWS